MRDKLLAKLAKDRPVHFSPNIQSWSGIVQSVLPVSCEADRASGATGHNFLRQAYRSYFLQRLQQFEQRTY